MSSVPVEIARRAPACIVAIGARTPVGRTARASAAAVRAGITRLAAHPHMVDKAGDPYIVAMNREIEAQGREARIVALAAPALIEVLVQIAPWIGRELVVHLGLPELAPGFDAAVVRRIVTRIGAAVAGPTVLSFDPIAEGNAAGLVGLQRAVDAIAGGRTELCIVAGVDSLLDPDLLETLDLATRLKSTTNRWGFPPGEGAGALAVASPRFARQVGAPILGWVVSATTAIDDHAVGSEEVCVGEGLSEALRNALGALELPAEPIQRTYCDLDGERHRSSEYAFSILRMHPDAFVEATDFVAPADCWGNVGAASGPLLVACALWSRPWDPLPSARSLVFASSDRGRRGAAVLHVQQGSSR